MFPTSLFSRSPRFRVFFVGVCFATLVSCEKHEEANEPQPRPFHVDAQAEADIRSFCGDCHAFPPPSSFARAAWPAEVKQGYDFYYQSSRTDLVPPPKQAAISWYQQRAPKHLQVVTTGHGCCPFPDRRFKPVRLSPSEAQQNCAIAHVNWMATGTTPFLMTCDMRTGVVERLLKTPDGCARETIAQLDNPCHVAATDLDADGQVDYVVADLGSFLPADHRRGKVWWISSHDNEISWDVTILADGLGRVADVQPIDVDGDGQLELVVAEFGWRQTGRILLLKNQATAAEPFDFVVSVLDKRHGTIHVPVADLNADGRPDFVAVISQEHEVVEAFLNVGDGTFDRRRVFAAEDPAFGSSGISLVDMDADGDLDILHTNGDSFDSAEAKPFHGLRWLENTGRFPFKVHEIARLPGVHRAIAGDLDGDGDLDVAAVTLLPQPVLEYHSDGTFSAVVWYKRIKTGKFIPLVIEQDTCRHTDCALADWNRDGALDLIVGNFNWRGTSSEPISIYENRGRLK